MEIKIAIYEDNNALRESLSYLIKGTAPFILIGEYANCLQIIENCSSNKPDIILMDIDMPYISGIEATRLVKNQFPEINVMMLTVFDDKERIFEALRAGATGYILKKSTTIQIIEAIVDLYNGGSPMSSSIARKVMEFFSQNNIIDNSYALSERETQVLRCLVKGDSYKMVSDSCCISIGTVRFHINGIYKKLAVNSKSEAVIKAIKEKLV